MPPLTEIVGMLQSKASRVGVLVFFLISAVAPMHGAAAFDHGYGRWDTLLKRSVVVSDDGTRSAVKYGSLKAERAQLARVLDDLSSVSAADYGSWDRSTQLAFLINAYNAFTIELVLTRYPELGSIKDIGGLFGSPWKQAFIPLLGRTISLDDLEHGIIRQPGIFNEPRIHVAVVCASIGCPMLRPEAYRPDRLDAQLEDAMRRFLSDRTRNRHDAGTNTLHVSRIFDWYRGDFEATGQDRSSLNAYLSAYAGALAENEAAGRKIRSGDFAIRFLKYDWRLNDYKAP
ncbi:DUF547 domain-containing protein [Ferrovibrio sp.]|uniref:DUF547 domain-containing protein n=1 Tax=Ferrovibrio sp. TaxID=1917215 RepID=UPI00261702EC|nr:DUF547 domain-containing protein [Ferrovibrio sp.]